MQLVVLLGSVIFTERADAHATKTNVLDDYVLFFLVIREVDTCPKESCLLPGMLTIFKADVKSFITIAFDLQLPISFFLILRDWQIFCLLTEWADNICNIPVFNQ